MTRSICMAVSLDYAMSIDNAAKRVCFGSKHTLAEINRAIMLAYNAGYKVVPPCDNTDERGRCLGHAKGEENQ